MKPCPFCGGVPDLDLVQHWTGTKYVVVTYRYRHLCSLDGFQGRIYIEFEGPTDAAAMALWERRA
jgi:hypothetical protein